MSKIMKGLVAALALTGASQGVGTDALAAGSSGFPHSYAVAQSDASVAPALLTISRPAVPRIGGCGPKRYLNSQTNQCQGPSDWR